MTAHAPASSAIRAFRTGSALLYAICTYNTCLFDVYYIHNYTTLIHCERHLLNFFFTIPTFNI
jgi:hypothetical protein